MRIGLDASPLTANRGGIGTHVRHLLEALIRIAPQHEYYMYAPHVIPEEDRVDFARHPHVRIIRCPAFLMGLRARWDGIDIFHGLNYKLRGWGRYGDVVTIHDLAMDRLAQPSRKLFGQRRSFLRTRRTARKAAMVVTVSAHAARDIVGLYGIPQERIAVISNAVGPEFYPVADPVIRDSVAARYGIRRRAFILSGGGSEPRKNIALLVEAFGRAPRLRDTMNLVVVGGMDHGAEAIRAAVGRAGLESAVVFPGHVPLDDLRALYSGCALFAFPSLYEGFGMPPLEAMACGAPVVCSNASSLPETVGDAALLVDPRDPDGWTRAMTRVADDAALREDLRRRGALRVKAFSWEQSARDLLRVYQEVVGGQAA